MQNAIKESKSKNLPILVDLYTDWCGYCKVLEREVFPHETIEKELKNFIPVRINGEVDTGTAGRYRVREYPTILFLDRNGAYLDRIIGLPSVEVLKMKMDEIYEKKNQETELKEIADKHPESILYNYNLALYYISAQEWGKAEKYLFRVYNSKEEELFVKKQEALLYLGISQLQQKKYSESISMFSKYITDYPYGDIYSSRYYRGLAYFYLQQFTESREDLNRAREYADTKSKVNAILEVLERM
ncbi:MAG: thioredoxin family protein [Leptospiraceae bacterium]|nr:thioredoxin family protein [Leptospiraceae bacterium]MCP5511836.1 thioredoxin family protein [Leptospiraceae bacterium]